MLLGKLDQIVLCQYSTVTGDHLWYTWSPLIKLIAHSEWKLCMSVLMLRPHFSVYIVFACHMEILWRVFHCFVLGLSLFSIILLSPTICFEYFCLRLEITCVLLCYIACCICVVFILFFILFFDLPVYSVYVLSLYVTTWNNLQSFSHLNSRISTWNWCTSLISL